MPGGPSMPGGPTPVPQTNISGDVTRLLRRWRAGHPDAQHDLFETVYGELRRLAASNMRNERAGHTLPPTGLVHEAFLRIPTISLSAGCAQLVRSDGGIPAGDRRRSQVDLRQLVSQSPAFSTGFGRAPRAWHYRSPLGGNVRRAAGSLEAELLRRPERPCR